MSSYSFPISSFTNGVSSHNLSHEVLDSLGFTFASFSLYNEDYTITFSQTLSPTEETTFNTIVANHNPATHTYTEYSQVNAIGTGQPCVQTNYKSIGKVFYNGKHINQLVNIKVVSYSSVAGSYSIRVYNLSSHNVIAEATFTNTSEQINDMGTLSNIPTSDNILDIQVKVSSQQVRAYVDTITFNYNK